MPNALRHNLELKARYADLRIAAQRIETFGARRAGVELQTDTYFCAAHGRLKLREIDEQSAVLIWYERPDRMDAKSSNYYLVSVAEAAPLKQALTAALGVRGVVQKRREIWLYENVRIHLDEVVGLGCFVEFEAVLTRDAELEVSKRLLGGLRDLLEIGPEVLLAPSYADLLGL